MAKLLKNKKGVATIYLAISMVVLLLFSALVVDIGMVALNKSDIQNACDAAALAGVQELPDTVKAESVAKRYAQDNGVNNVIVSFTNSNTKITVTAENKPVDFFFARVIGINQGLVSAKASAVKAAINSVGRGIRPFGVTLDSVKGTLETLSTLKEGAGINWSGNFGAVNLDGVAGADAYKASITSGSKYGHYIGEEITTETGNMVGPTNTGVSELLAQCTRVPQCTATNYIHPDGKECPRLITIPIVNTIDVNGHKVIVIVGFARFFLAGASGGEVTGTFINIVPPGEIDSLKPAPSGSYWPTVVKLID